VRLRWVSSKTCDALPPSASHVLDYARAHDRTVAEDYYAAMEVVEKGLEAIPPEKEDDADPPVNDDERAQLLELAMRLAEPELDVETRLDLVEQMCEVLNHRTPKDEEQPTENENGRRPRAPAGYLLGASPAFPWVHAV
jgi:hypothetical protein